MRRAVYACVPEPAQPPFCAFSLCQKPDTNAGPRRQKSQITRGYFLESYYIKVKPRD
jgi:hypothetical protein